jgi:CheY-like chemotaxis protein
MNPDSPVLSDSSSPATGAHKPLRILIVDDSEAIRVFMRAKLKALSNELYDLQLDAVASGEDAVSRCAAQAYDLVFMDVVMPGMGGIEACRQIMAAH